MLLANYAQQNRNTVREWGMGFSNPLGQFRPTLFPAFYCPSQAAATGLDKSAFNNGYADLFAWHLSPKAGGLGSTNNLVGIAAVTPALSSGINVGATIAGVGDLTPPSLSLVTALASALAGTGAITADLAASLQLAASLAGSGDLTGSLGLIGWVVANLTGTGSITADARGTLSMSADITPFSELSPESLAAAVWNAIAASFNEAGTMGEKMNDAGSAANPWTEEIETGYTAEELLRLIASALLGKLDGAETTTITFRDVNDTIDRIVATVDGNGNRDTVTLDPA
jgi:hypothetical protein